MEVSNECRVEHSHRIIVDFEHGTGPIVNVSWGRGNQKISVQRLVADADPNTGGVAQYVEIKRGVYVKKDGTPGERTVGSYHRTALNGLPEEVRVEIAAAATEARHEVTV